MLLLNKVVPGAEGYQVGVVRWRRNGDAASTAYISVTQLIRQHLQLVGVEVVVIPEDMIVWWSTGSLNTNRNMIPWTDETGFPEHIQEHDYLNKDRNMVPWTQTETWFTKYGQKHGSLNTDRKMVNKYRQKQSSLNTDRMILRMQTKTWFPKYRQKHGSINTDSFINININML